MDYVLKFGLGVILGLLCGIGGYILKTRIIRNRLEGIVDFILADIKDHEGVDWNDIEDLEEMLRYKWGEVIKRGWQGYYQWLEHRLGRPPIKVGDGK